MSFPVFYVVEGDILPIPFSSYDGATGASEAISGLAVTDIEIYKDVSVTQRASDNGYTLTDTDGIDVDGAVGINGFSVDISDNSDAGFYEVGPWYAVKIISITADAQTVNFIAAMFRIVSATRGLAGTALPAAAADAAGGLVISDAGGLDADAQRADVAAILVDTGTTLDDFIDTEVAAIVTALGTAGAGLTAVPWNAAWDAEVQSEVADALAVYDPPTNAEMEARTLVAANYATATALDTVDNFLDTEIAAILAAVDTEVAAIKAVTDLLPNAGALSDLATQASVNTIDDFLDTEIAAIVTATGAAAIRTALGLGSANLDTQLDALPTTAEVLTQVNAALDTAIAELGVAAPTATPTLRTGLMLLYMALRNKTTSTATEQTISNNAGTTIAAAALSDDGTTFEKAEFA